MSYKDTGSERKESESKNQYDDDMKSESKSVDRESKNIEDSLDSKEIISKVQEFFFMNEELAHSFESFIDKHSHVVNLDTEEYKLEYTEVFNDYKKLFENKMETYITKDLNCSITDFYRALKKETENDADSSEAVFGQILASITDFDIFMVMMRESAAKQNIKKKMDYK